MTKISVVIPTKDDPGVFDAIDSVLDQGYDKFELIVVDASEGSIKESLESKCGSEDVEYIYQPDHDHTPNLNGARNLGVENSSGDIIALMDGDCTAEEDWLENLLPYFENHQVVECNVQYASEDRNCPMDRIVENDGRNYGFLGAGLAFTRAVWEEAEFDEEVTFHDDTAFGFEALGNNFSYTYGQQARINHHSGRFSITDFVSERMRFAGEAKFFEKYSDSRHYEKEVSHIGRLLYPKEFAMLLAVVIAAGVSLYNTVISGLMISAIMAATTFVYVNRERGKVDMDLCPLDLLKLFFLVPLTFIFVKRLAIWKGALKERVPVV